MAAAELRKYSYCDKEYQFTSGDRRSIEKYLCVICLQLLFDPVQTSCGHLFCERCLKQWKGRACPTCKTAFTRPATPDNFNNREVKNLTVLCPNASRGCEWKGELGSVEAHEEDDCAYQLVQCPNKCGTEVERRELDEHQEDHCELRQYECPYCTVHKSCLIEKDTYRYITTYHYEACSYYPVDCPNTCAVKGLVRRDLPTHLAVCPDEVIPCRYRALGCKVRLARKKMSSHLEDKDRHLVLAMGTTSDLTLQLSQHKSATDSQQQQITSLEQKVSILLNKTGIRVPPVPTPSAKPWLKVDPLPLLYPPFTIKTDTSTKDEVVSPPFLSHQGGYRLAIKVKVGYKRTIFISLIPIDCPQNHSLKWPVTITVKCVILNQAEDKGHMVQERYVRLNYYDDCLFSSLAYVDESSTVQDPENPIYYIKVLITKIKTF